MKKYIILCFLFVLTSCASLNNSPHLSNIQSFSNTYTYMAKDLNGVVISNDDINDALMNSINRNTKYPYKTWVTNGANSSVSHVYGVKVNLSSSGYNVSYRNGTLAGYGYSVDDFSSTSFTVNKEISNSGNYAVLKTTLNSQANVFDTTVLFIKTPQVDSIDNLYSDLKNGLSKNATIDRTYVLSGEMNSVYNADSIYANFQRSFGAYNWDGWKGTDNVVKSYDIKKENTYKLSFNGSDIPLNIVVYPYRNQSKVIYKVLIPYKLNSDGTATLSPAQIDPIKEKIKSIINS